MPESQRCRNWVTGLQCVQTNVSSTALCSCAWRCCSSRKSFAASASASCINCCKAVSHHAAETGLLVGSFATASNVPRSAVSVWCWASRGGARFRPESMLG
eukprot:scaffold1042_cov401-Prasinococcus_capsulatus_cf.AAC.43